MAMNNQILTPEEKKDKIRGRKEVSTASIRVMNGTLSQKVLYRVFTLN